MTNRGNVFHQPVRRPIQRENNLQTNFSSDFFLSVSCLWSFRRPVWNSDVAVCTNRLSFLHWLRIVKSYYELRVATPYNTSHLVFSVELRCQSGTQNRKHLSLSLLLWLPLSMFCMPNRNITKLCYSSNLSLLSSGSLGLVWHRFWQSFLRLGLPFRSLPRPDSCLKQKEKEGTTFHVFQIHHVGTRGCFSLGLFRHGLLQVLSRWKPLRRSTRALLLLRVEIRFLF
jgi:hypothetical protein